MNKFTVPKMFGRNPTIQIAGSTPSSAIFRWMFLLVALLVPQVMQAAQWNATVGAQTHDQGHQALAFLPNEIWIHAGDRITWHFDVPEIHTVTFLADGQPRPFFADGCPGFSSDPATFDGSTCVTTPPLVEGQAFTVIFPTAGNFKLLCLVHENMDGTIHVLASSEPLPHNQAFYDQQAAEQRRDLLTDRDSQHHHDSHGVTAGIGEVSTTGGGSRTVSAMRFSHDRIEIRAGETVEWTNQDPVTPHTITFGTEPPGDPFPPSPDVTVDSDGARHAIIDSTSDSTHSGFIVAPPQERLGLPSAPLGVTRFRVTFPNAGTFPYICALHDDLGMRGRVIVRPTGGHADAPKEVTAR
jgi:plastocyanin